MLAEKIVQAPMQPSAAAMIPPEFRENWKKVLASAPSTKNYRAVRVLGGVASITNGHIVIRSPLEMPDGFYLISGQNELFPARPTGWLDFPDVEQIRPPFDKHLAVIPHDVIGQFIHLCEGARQAKAGILVDAHGMCWVQAPQNRVNFPLGLPGDGVECLPSDMALALFELLRYSTVGLWKETRLDQAAAPLVLGIDWAKCVLISADNKLRYHYY